MDDSIGTILSFSSENDKKYIYNNIKEIKVPFLKQVPINTLLKDELFIAGLSLDDFEHMFKNSSWDREDAFLNIVKRNRFDVVKLFLCKNILSEDSLKKVMKYSCEKNNKELLKLLLKYTKLDPVFENSICIKIACLYIHVDILKILLEDGRADPTADDSECIKIAFGNPYYDYIRSGNFRYSEKSQSFEQIYNYYSDDDDDGKCVGCRYCNPYSKEEEEKERVYDINNNKVLNLLLEDGRASCNDWFKNIDTAYNNYKTLCVIKDRRTNILNNKKFIESILRDSEIDFIIQCCHSLKRCSLPYDNTEKNIKTLRLACMSEIEKRQYKGGHYIFEYKNDYRFIPANKTPKSFKYNHVFIDACKYGNKVIVETLLKDNRVNPAFQDNMAFIIACKYGKYKIVKMLLKDKRVDPTSRNNEAFVSICKKGILNGDTDITMWFLVRDPRVRAAKNSFKIALMYAKKNKDKLLLKHLQVKYSVLQK